MGKLEQIKTKLAGILTNMLQLSVVKTDKAVLEIDGDEIKNGISVFVENENGEKLPAENGEYKTEDGKIITVENGKITNVVDAPVEEETPNEEVNAEETPADEEEKPIDETPADEEEEKPADDVKAEETEGDAIAELREEVDELYKIVDSILDKIGETRREADERFAKIEKMSASVNAEDKLEELTNNATPATGDKALDNKLSRIKQMNRNWRD